MAHWYWTAKCKTPECGEQHRVSYIGDFPFGAPFATAPPIGVSDLRCERCDKVHDYQSSDVHLYLGKAPGAGRM